MAWLPDCEKVLICLIVWTRKRWTDKRTDRHHMMAQAVHMHCTALQKCWESWKLRLVWWSSVDQQHHQHHQLLPKPDYLWLKFKKLVFKTKLQFKTIYLLAQARHTAPHTPTHTTKHFMVTLLVLGSSGGHKVVPSISSKHSRQVKHLDTKWQKQISIPSPPSCVQCLLGTGAQTAYQPPW